MQKILVVVDMQNDFIDGALGTKDAFAIVEPVRRKIDSFTGKIYFTRDTHEDDYLQTQEGRNLPVVHCVRGTDGWEISDALADCRKDRMFDKPTFGSVELMKAMVEENEREAIERVTLIGLCTDICVISNAMLLKAALPHVEIVVDASCCAGVTPESHSNALAAMKMCQIQIENEI